MIGRLFRQFLSQTVPSSRSSVQVAPSGLCDLRGTVTAGVIAGLSSCRSFRSWCRTRILTMSPSEITPTFYPLPRFIPSPTFLFDVCHPSLFTNVAVLIRTTWYLHKYQGFTAGVKYILPLLRSLMSSAIRQAVVHGRCLQSRMLCRSFEATWIRRL